MFSLSWIRTTNYWRELDGKIWRVLPLQIRKIIPAHADILAARCRYWNKTTIFCKSICSQYDAKVRHKMEAKNLQVLIEEIVFLERRSCTVRGAACTQNSRDTKKVIFKLTWAWWKGIDTHRSRKSYPIGWLINFFSVDRHKRDAEFFQWRQETVMLLFFSLHF